MSNLISSSAFASRLKKAVERQANTALLPDSFRQVYKLIKFNIVLLIYFFLYKTNKLCCIAIICCPGNKK